MKTYKLILVLGISICLLNACEDTTNDEIIQDELQTDAKLQSERSMPVEVAYRGKMFTSQAEDALSVICEVISPTNFWAEEHQVGGGNATHIGNFTIDLKFCFHIVLNDQGFPDIEGGFGEYMGGDGMIVANNGDILYTYGEGNVLIPIDDELYSFKFESTFNVTGGTGRFENASGGFINYGKVRRDGSGTDHVQKGTIILN